MQLNERRWNLFKTCNAAQRNLNLYAKLQLIYSMSIFYLKQLKVGLLYKSIIWTIFKSRFAKDIIQLDLITFQLLRLLFCFLIKYFHIMYKLTVEPWFKNFSLTLHKKSNNKVNKRAIISATDPTLIYTWEISVWNSIIFRIKSQRNYLVITKRSP